jgi:hypothetical protein
MFAILLLAKNFIRSNPAKDCLPGALRQHHAFRRSCGKRFAKSPPRLAAYYFPNDPSLLIGKNGTASPAGAEILSSCPAEESEHAYLIEAMRFDS